MKTAWFVDASGWDGPGSDSIDEVVEKIKSRMIPSAHHWVESGGTLDDDPDFVVVLRPDGRYDGYEAKAWREPKSEPMLPWSAPEGDPVARVSMDGTVRMLSSLKRVEADYTPDAPPSISWSGGNGKGAIMTGTARAYDATATIMLMPKGGRDGGFTFKLFYSHNPSASNLAAGATPERNMVLDEGTTTGSGEWGRDDWAGPAWKDLGAVFLWSAARDSTPVFDWPEWVKAGPESLPWYKRWVQ